MLSVIRSGIPLLDWPILQVIPTEHRRSFVVQSDGKAGWHQILQISDLGRARSSRNDKGQRWRGEGMSIKQYRSGGVREILIRLVLPAATMLMIIAGPVSAQDMMKGLDLSSPEMTEAEMTRDDVEAELAATADGQPLDLTGKRLNGVDLSGLDLSGAILRSARLNKADLNGANLEGAILDQAWILDANLRGANLRNANLFQAQLIGSILDGADFSGARVASDLSRASLKGAKFVGASLGADMQNQSMGLMRGVLRKADLDGADFSDADLSRVDFEFASLKDANLTGANLMRASLGGADLTRAIVDGANFNEADVTSAKLKALVGADRTNLERARNLKAAFRD